MIVCHGHCELLKRTDKEWKKPPTGGIPFLTHGYCRVCVLWVKRTNTVNGNRCPCYHNKITMKPRTNRAKKKYIGAIYG